MSEQEFIIGMANQPKEKTALDELKSYRDAVLELKTVFKDAFNIFAFAALLFKEDAIKQDIENGKCDEAKLDRDALMAVGKELLNDVKASRQYAEDIMKDIDEMVKGINNRIEIKEPLELVEMELYAVQSSVVTDNFANWGAAYNFTVLVGINDAIEIHNASRSPEHQIKPIPIESLVEESAEAISDIDSLEQELNELETKIEETINE